MSEARTIGKTIGNWAGPSEIRLFAQRIDVSATSSVYRMQEQSNYESSLDTFDEYTRRQYVAKAPHRNPFGTDETPNKFVEFHVFTKLRVLFQLSQWTLINADRMRERMQETKDTDQTQWVSHLGSPKTNDH